jgi:hypothetical protein
MKKIILLLLSFVSTVNSQVIIIDYEEILKQYERYVSQNDSLIKGIINHQMFIEDYLEKISDNSDTNFVNRCISDYSIKYIPYCSISLLEERNDSLFCKLTIDNFHIPEAYIYKDNELVYSLHLPNFSLYGISKPQEECVGCIENNNEQIIINICNIDLYSIKIDFQQRTINCPIDCKECRSISSWMIKNNVLSKHIANVIRKLKYNEECQSNQTYYYNKELENLHKK